MYIYIMYVYMFLYVIYVKSSFLKLDKPPLKKWACNGYVKFIENVLEKSFSHMNTCIYMYIFMTSFLCKAHSPNLALAL